MTLIWCSGRGKVTLTSAPLADWHGPLACRVARRLGSHHDAGDVAREAFCLTSDVAYLAGMLTTDVAYLAGMLTTGASIAVWTASSRMGNAPAMRLTAGAAARDFGAPTFTGPGQRHQTGEIS
jgi:hypothetical protein